MQLTLGGKPLSPLGRTRIYVCGITPYDTTHLGHASTFIWADLLSRVLRQLGVEPQVCRNVTDVDDVLLAEAARLGVPWRQLATQQTYRFEEDMRKLRVERPPYEPASVDYVNEVIFLVRALVDADAAYDVDGTVFFRGDGIAERSGVSEADARVALAASGDDPDDQRKHHPLDVAVWKSSSGDEPAWQSPWGNGRPGWHVECSAMATTLLGLAIDVHAGGADLAFPHHAYSSAIVEAATGVAPFARSALHVGTVCVNGAKMAKSTGNLVFVEKLLRDHHPAAIRLMILRNGWTDQWDYTPSLLDDAQADLEALWSAAGAANDDDKSDMAVLEALASDLNASAAVDLAIEAGGSAARLATKVLALN